MNARLEYAILVGLLCAFWLYNGAVTWKQNTPPTKESPCEPSQHSSCP